MYTAVSVVQANNSANADEVGKAMKKHAEMGLRGQRLREEALERQEKQQQRERERQQDRQEDRQDRLQDRQDRQRQQDRQDRQDRQREDAAYVARAVGGTVEVGSGAQVGLGRVLVFCSVYVYAAPFCLLDGSLHH